MSTQEVSLWRNQSWYPNSSESSSSIRDMTLPMKSTSLAEVLTPGQTVADCINHCRRSWQEILCIQLPHPTLGLVLSPHCMWHLELTQPTDIIKSHRIGIGSWLRHSKDLVQKKCSVIAISRWQITVVFDEGLWLKFTIVTLWQLIE